MQLEKLQSEWAFCCKTQTQNLKNEKVVTKPRLGTYI